MKSKFCENTFCKRPQNRYKIIVLKVVKLNFRRNLEINNKITYHKVGDYYLLNLILKKVNIAIIL